MKQIKGTNQRWTMKSILPLAAMVAAVIGLAMPAMAGPYHLAISSPGLHLNVQPKSKVHPVIRRAAVPSKKSAHKKKNRSRAGAAARTTRPPVSSGVPAVTRRPRRGSVAGRQMLPVGRPKLGGARRVFPTRNLIPNRKLKESAIGRSAGGFTGKGGFAPRHGGGFAPALGGATSGTPSLVDRARDAIGGNKHPSGGGGALIGNGGSTSSQNPDAAGHGGSHVIRLNPLYIYGRRSREHPSGGGGTAGGQGGTHFDRSSGTIDFGDGEQVPGTDPSGTPGTINSDGTVDYSDGTHASHDYATGDTTITHSDGTTTTRHRGDGVPTDEYVATHPSGGGGTAGGQGGTHFDKSSGTIDFGDGEQIPGTDPSGAPGRINSDGTVDYSDGTHASHDTATGDTTITHPDGTTTTRHRGDGVPTDEYVATHSSGNKHSNSSSSGDKHSNSSSSGNKHSSSSSSGGTHSSSSSSGGKHSSSSSSGDKHSSSSSSGGKHSSSSSSGDKHSSSSSSDDTKSDSKDSSKPDKKSGKDKSMGEGGSGITSGGSAQDIYNKLHKPGDADAPSNGGHARGDVSQPGAGHSSGSGSGGKAGKHIHTGGNRGGRVVPGNLRGTGGTQRGGKRPLNMVDPDRFSNGARRMKNSAAEQFHNRGQAVNPGGH